MYLEPGVLALKQHISLSLGRISFLLIGADEDHAGYLAVWPYVEQGVHCLLYCAALSNAIELNTVTVKRKAEGEGLIA
jgi:hypothetical protein